MQITGAVVNASIMVHEQVNFAHKFLLRVVFFGENERR